MADPLSIASGIVALVTFALTSSVNLYTTIRNFQSQDKKARALKIELSDITTVLESLLETVNNNPDINFEALKAPLHRCGNACNEYGELICRFTRRSTASRSSVRDWVTQKYLQGDITDFKDMLAGYKSTINIALANANIRVAAITPRVLEDYKDMISDTTQDLKEHLQRLDEKIQLLSHSDQSNTEWQAMIEEKMSTQQGLEICAQLSKRIEELEPVPEENYQFSERPSAHKYVKSGLDAAKGSINKLVTQLRNHEEDIDNRMQVMASTHPISKDAVAELERLRATKASIHQCIQVISDAGDTRAVERHNVFEDITLADDAYNFTISTIGDLVTARRINLTGRSRNVGGQISDESYQRTIDRFSEQAIQNSQEVTKIHDQSASMPSFGNRHGPGLRLSSLVENSKTSNTNL
ncbi:hypothetical protein TrVFT333_002460 [Trichoderma virens FT-333]|nr:hypothetical protein TrVFT333_002460 [Trichoderma virens FT-333]